jgi:hypothetical protein
LFIFIKRRDTKAGETAKNVFIAVINLSKEFAGNVPVTYHFTGNLPAASNTTYKRRAKWAIIIM